MQEDFDPKLIAFASQLPEIRILARSLWPAQNTQEINGKIYDEWEYQLMMCVVADDPLEYFTKRVQAKTTGIPTNDDMRPM